jgi:hypothetical protein
MHIVIQPDIEILDAWTPQEAEELFGGWRPPAVIARLPKQNAGNMI